MDPRGGRTAAPGASALHAARAWAFGDEVYLWVLVALELVSLVALRSYFRSAHGG